MEEHRKPEEEFWSIGPVGEPILLDRNPPKTPLIVNIAIALIAAACIGFLVYIAIQKGV